MITIVSPKIPNIPSIKLPIIVKGKSFINSLSKITANKQIIIFGVPGSFTPTCSEKHLPGYINLCNEFHNMGIDDIYCLAVNDVFVLKAWLSSFPNANLINGIADGNGEFTKAMNLEIDYSENFMGSRCKRFALVANNNVVDTLYVEKKGEFLVSSAEYVLENFVIKL